MAISILYLNDRNNSAEPIQSRILYHLSLDRSFSNICADVKKRERFLYVVSDLTNDKNEILYRQAVVKDFKNNPALLEQLASHSRSTNENIWWFSCFYKKVFNIVYFHKTEITEYIILISFSEN